MRRVVFLLVCLLALHFASARLVVTEIMYHPSPEQGGNYNEWVELYNDGHDLDFSGYTINGKSISSMNVSSNQIFVIGEKTTGNGSLDSYYGNNDGVWDSSDPFTAVDATSFSLDDSSGIVNISNGVDEIVVSYVSSSGADGNGKTLERISLASEEFRESSEVGGSPGSFSENFSSTSDGTVGVEASITNVAPSVISIVIRPDDGPEDGIQVYPDYNNAKYVSISAEVVDGNGVDDLSEVVLEVAEKTPELVGIEDLNETLVRYSWNLTMNADDREGVYYLNVTAKDSQGSSDFNYSQFEYAGLLSISLSPGSINFGSLNPGSSSMANITVRNNGNSVIDVEVSGTNLTNGDKLIPVSKIEGIYNTNWFELSYEARTIDMNLQGNLEDRIGFRFNAPFGFKADKYTGTITIAAVRS
ncbi:MAG: hypothetical protein QXR60_01960 [Candidatus Nanoarchaeia archaeon]